MSRLEDLDLGAKLCCRLEIEMGFLTRTMLGLLWDLRLPLVVLLLLKMMNLVFVDVVIFSIDCCKGHGLEVDSD
jgi:hypothetical protein